MKQHSEDEEDPNMFQYQTNKSGSYDDDDLIAKP